MGNIFGEFLKDDEKITPVTNLKLESQKIVEFLGGNNEWQKWKTRTMCAFKGSGSKEILEDEDYADAHPRMNRIVYSQLSVATVVGTAHHLHSRDRILRFRNLYLPFKLCPIFPHWTWLVLLVVMILIYLSHNLTAIVEYTINSTCDLYTLSVTQGAVPAVFFPFLLSIVLSDAQ